MRQVAVTALRTAAVIDVPDLTGPLKPDEVRGRTVVSLISPGTELNWAFTGKNDRYPVFPGYAAVFAVEEIGAEVKDLSPGDLVMGAGNHKEWQQFARKDVAPLPKGLAAEQAVFCRLAGVTMSTLNTTAARVPSRVLVTGLGPVGNLAAQMFALAGYDVTAIDPVKQRCELARQLGLKDVRASLAEGADIAGQVALHVECSGHEQAVLDGCRSVRKRGEVVLVGAPWRRYTEIYAAELISVVFHKYVVLRSGWEWEVPMYPHDFAGNSIMGNFAAAMEWIRDGRLKVDGLATGYAPARGQEVYDGLLAQSLPTPGAMFDWRSK